MKVKIKTGNGTLIDADWTIEDDVMIVSPKKAKKYQYEPKDGEVVVYMNDDLPTIYIYRAGKPNNTFYYAAYSTLNQVVFVSNGTDHLCGNREDIRPATEQEKQKLFDKLTEEGFAWDSEKRQIVRFKWKPRENERYYYPANYGYGFVLSDTCFNSICKNDVERIKSGRYFKDKQECQAFCDRLNEAISDIKP